MGISREVVSGRLYSNIDLLPIAPFTAAQVLTNWLGKKDSLAGGAE